MHATPAAVTASAQRRARSRSRSTGFSQKIALPAAAARWIKSACVSVLEAMTTAPTAGSVRAASGSVNGVAPCSAASSAADARNTSTT